MRRITSAIYVLILVTSCTREVPYLPDNARDFLLMNAQIDASEKSHSVWLGVSKTSTIDKMEDASIICLVNGEEVATATFDEAASMDKIQSCYRFDAELKPGDTVRISAQGQGLSAFAETTVPDTCGRLIMVDTLSANGKMHFSAFIRDEADGLNYYRLRVKVHNYQAYYYEGAWSRWYYHSEEKTISHTNDPILNGRIGGTEGDDFFGIGGNSNHYCTFTDRLFSNSSAIVEFDVDTNELYQIYADQYFDSLITIPYVEISILSINSEEFNYLNLQNILFDNDYDTSDLLEPISLPANVIGGTGFVGVFYPSSITLQLPQKRFGNEDL